MKCKSNEIENLPTNRVLFQPYDNGKYDIGDKKVVIELMESDLKMHNGVLVPKSVKWSEILDIPDSTLRSWYLERETIRMLADKVGGSLPTIIGTRMLAQAVRISIELEKKVTSGKMSARDMINLLKVNITYSRLLLGKSTANVSHQHQMSPIPPPPQKEE